MIIWFILWFKMGIKYTYLIFEFKNGLIVYDISSDLFSESYEYITAANSMSYIIDFNNRLFYFGWNTNTNKAVISSAKLGNLALLPDISVSSTFTMSQILSTEYSITTYSITNDKLHNFNLVHMAYNLNTVIFFN